MSQVSEGKNIMIQGRIVWTVGDLFKGRGKTDQNTRQPIIDQKTGLQKMEYGFGLAVPLPDQTKQNPEEYQRTLSNFQMIWEALHEQAYLLYPSRQVPPQFAWKYKDGNTGVDHNGQPFNQREGYPGNYVFSCTTSIPIKFYRYDGGQYVQVNDSIKCGDYVNVQLSVKGHPAQGQGKPGLYLNPNAVLFLGFGKEIINAPSAEQIFGNQAPALPPGASATPIAPEGFMPGFGPQQPAQPAYGQPPVVASPAGYPPAQPNYGQPSQVAPVQPNYNVLPPIHQPPQQQQAPQMPPMGNGFAQGAGQPYQQPNYPPSGQNMMPGGSAPTASPSNGMPPLPGVPR